MTEDKPVNMKSRPVAERLSVLEMAVAELGRLAGVRIGLVQSEETGQIKLNIEAIANKSENK